MYDSTKGYNGIRTFETAAVTDNGSFYNFLFLTTCTEQWVFPNPDSKDSIIGELTYLPLNTLSATRIREAQLKGQDIKIKKNWMDSKEVLPVHIMINEVTDLEGAKKYWRGKITQMVNPHVAQITAMDIYGFTVINNKFIENGFVFSKKNRALKYMDIIDRTEDMYLTEDGTKEADQLLELLREYTAYSDKLERCYFMWNKTQEAIKLIDEVEEESTEDSEAAIEKIVKIGTDFINSITTLNNIK